MGVRWVLMSQLDDKSSVLTEGSVNVVWLWVNYYGNGFLKKHLGFLCFISYWQSLPCMPTCLLFLPTHVQHMPLWEDADTGCLYLRGGWSELAPSRSWSFHYYLTAMENRHGQEVYSITVLTLFLKKDHRSGETQQLRALASHLENLSLVPGTHTGRVKASYM